MYNAYLIVTWAIGTLAVALVLFVATLTGRRLAGDFRRRARRRVERVYRGLVAHVAAGTARPERPDLKLRTDGVGWEALDELVRAAIQAAEPDAAARLTRFAAASGLAERCRHQLRHGGGWERARAAARLADYRCAEALDDLLHATEDPDPAVRTAAVRALGRLGDDAAIQVLADVLARVHGGADRLSVRVISGNLARFGPEAGERVVPLLSHPVWRVRGAALFVLGEVVAAHHTGAMIACLADAEPDVRAKAAQALGKLAARGALFPLLGRLEDPSWLVRMHTARALGRLADPAAIAALARCLTDGHWRVRQEAAHSLAASGGAALAALTETVLASPDRFAREQVVEELQRTPLLRDTIDRLQRLALEDVPTAPEAALLTAVAKGGAVSVMLAALAGHGSAHVRRVLVRVVAPLPNPRIDAALARAAANDPDMLVRHDAAHALKERAPDTEVA
ncbi:MAG: HEAT repeat domain-containing protein [Nitrospirae bacterium]|nr:HEAT repeat domain-containing protein [Nitrospirota bacterium]